MLLFILFLITPCGLNADIDDPPIVYNASTSYQSSVVNVDIVTRGEVEG